MNMKSKMFSLLATSALLARESFSDFNNKMEDVVNDYYPPPTANTRGKFPYNVHGETIEAESKKDAKRIYSRKHSPSKK